MGVKFLAPLEWYSSYAISSCQPMMYQQGSIDIIFHYLNMNVSHHDQENDTPQPISFSFLFLQELPARSSH